MPELIVKPVLTQREKEQFLALPQKLYRNDPNWVMPEPSTVRSLVGYQHHPYYDDAEAQTFLALCGSQVCGRVAAIINHAHNRRYNERCCFFGFFECVDDQQVASSLLDAARAWVVARKMQVMRGPTNPSMNYGCGLLIDGFDSPPTVGTTYNPAYYARLIDRAGFHKVQDMYAYQGHIDMLDTMDPKLEFVVNEARRRYRVNVRPISMSRFEEEARMVLELHNQSLGNIWGFVPLSDSEMRHRAAAMRRMIFSDLTSVAEVDGQVVGVVHGLVDCYIRNRRNTKKPLPSGYPRILPSDCATRRMRIIRISVRPDYVCWGLGLVLLERLIPGARARGIEEAEFSRVMETNRIAMATLQRAGAIRTKTYRIYDGRVDTIVS